MELILYIVDSITALNYFQHCIKHFNINETYCRVVNVEEDYSSDGKGVVKEGEGQQGTVPETQSVNSVQA